MTKVKNKTPDVETLFTGLLDNHSKKSRVMLCVLMTMRQGYRCCYCKEHLTLEIPQPGDQINPKYATFEHTIDKIAGAGVKDDNIENIMIACRWCNGNRGALSERRAKRWYKQFFFKSTTLNQFIEHPKCGWGKIVAQFGPIPKDFPYEY